MKNSHKKAAASYAVNLVLVLLLFAALYFLVSSGTVNRYYADLISLVCINVTLAVSLNLVTGVLGQLVLGHAGFMLAVSYTQLCSSSSRRTRSSAASNTTG